MKKVIIVLAILLQSSFVISEEKVRITSGEWPPYISPSLKHDGVVSRIVKEAFTLEGVNVEYGYFPWKRSYDYANNGSWDGTIAWIWNEEREQIFYYSDPIFISKRSFFYLSSYSFDWKSMEDLKGIRIGAQLGSNYGTPFQEAEKSGLIDVVRVKNFHQLMYMLINKRVDVIPMSDNVAYYTLQKNFKPSEIQQVKKHPTPLDTKDFHLIMTKINKNNQIMIEKFNKGLGELKKTGKYDQYFEESQRGEYINYDAETTIK